MRIQSNNPYYRGKQVQFKNEDIKFDKNGVAEVSEKMAEYLMTVHKGFYEEGKADEYKDENQIEIEKFTGDVQKKYLEEISKLKSEKEDLLKKIEKLEVSEKAWRENYINLEKKMKGEVTNVEKVESTPIEEPTKEEEVTGLEEVEELSKEDKELIELLESLTKDELKAFALENGIKESEFGQKREKGLIELIMNKLSK